MLQTGGSGQHPELHSARSSGASGRRSATLSHERLFYTAAVRNICAVVFGRKLTDWTRDRQSLPRPQHLSPQQLLEPRRTRVRRFSLCPGVSSKISSSGSMGSPAKAASSQATRSAGCIGWRRWAEALGSNVIRGQVNTQVRTIPNRPATYPSGPQPTLCRDQRTSGHLGDS